MSSVLVTSELNAVTTLEAAIAWRRRLFTAIAELPPGSAVRLLVDQTGYRPATLRAHRVVRTVVPDVLARHGMRPALADLYPSSAIQVEPHPAVRIKACAMVHHDAAKMADLDSRFGRRTQRFFGDRSLALRWLERLGDGGRCGSAALGGV